MIGTLFGLMTGIGICVQAFNGELQVWSLAAVVVAVVIGFIFPITVGTFLTVVASASPIAALLGFIFGNASSGLAALGIGLLAFAGQFVIGMVRRDQSELGHY